MIRHQRCVSVLGSSDQECLDREIIVSECYYSKTVPRDLWQNWKECKKLAGDDAPEVCTTELEEYVFLICNIRGIKFYPDLFAKELTSI